jgi:DHA2 family multidrug resistance protein
MTTLLARGAQTHQAAIATHLTPYDPAFQQRLQQIMGAVGLRGGGGGAAQQALASVYGVVLRQSMLMSFIDNFRLLAGLSLLCVPAALLFKRVRARGGPSVAAH